MLRQDILLIFYPDCQFRNARSLISGLLVDESRTWSGPLSVSCLVWTVELSLLVTRY